MFELWVVIKIVDPNLVQPLYSIYKENMLSCGWLKASTLCCVIDCIVNQTSDLGKGHVVFHIKRIHPLWTIDVLSKFHGNQLII